MTRIPRFSQVPISQPTTGGDYRSCMRKPKGCPAILLFSSISFPWIPKFRCLIPAMEIRIRNRAPCQRRGVNESDRVGGGWSERYIVAETGGKALLRRLAF